MTATLPELEQEYFELDFTKPFSEAISELRSEKNRPMKVGSHVYHVLAAMFNGQRIDDYSNPPQDYDGRVIRNVPQRVNEIVHKWRIKVESGKAEGKHYVEYWIDREAK